MVARFVTQAGVTSNISAASCIEISSSTGFPFASSSQIWNRFFAMANPKDEPCSCPIAQFCDRSKRSMSPRLHQLCREKPKYRRLFHGLPAPERSVPRGPCRFFGDLIRLETCELGCKKGTKIKVVRCGHPSLGGISVSAIPYRADQADGTCKGCDFYQSTPSPTAK